MALPDLDGMNQLSIELQLDTDVNLFPIFSTTSTCSSLDPKFAPYAPSSPIDFKCDHRPSIPTSETSLLLSSQGDSLRNSLSPMTPYSSDIMDMMMTSGASMGCTTADLSIYRMFQYSDPAPEEGSFHWNASESKQRLPGQSAAFNTPQQYSVKQQHPEVFLSTNQTLVAGAALESSLSRSIFHSRQPSDTLVAEHMTQWRPSMLQTPPRTVAPSATFQPIVPSSPAYHLTPSTPIQNKYETPIASGTASTPYSSSPICSSSKQLVSIHEDSNCSIVQPTLVRNLRQSKCKGSGRSSRRTAERKQSGRSGRPSKPRMSREGMEYPEYIPENQWPCTAEDCVDKNGKRKKFKRQEHLKRHQRTCHTGIRPHYCWVPGCTTKPFSRTDNLNSHLHKTHGKNSPAARNRYIATLDPKSGVYDVDYRGPFTESGWPIRSK
ncbi:hypothetical protein EPUS_02810 [Endocarpon pusillum Z07020]|uniref:C2H2-type domain-containing protein n=1 Tax=Endocarpon pusillum (strain Z07020 / HMAS-L-300199) TaxID=1263415 RepID=U1HTE4_ENDPU|nr:uncharacterized protein EPUS_02810 [Endocarpon pusillum Z07020]ERF72529.1 hypothetical protein EPUS_02810 [Endocarpon pusillum Z07020]